jgi:hypothetical protein
MEAENVAKEKKLFSESYRSTIANVGERKSSGKRLILISLTHSSKIESFGPYLANKNYLFYSSS